MKNILLFLCVAIASNALAQIPNNGFEDWTDMTGYFVPNLWSTMNHTTDAYSLYTVTKGTPGSPGSSYMKLTSKTINGSVVNGIAVSGELDSIAMKPISGFAYTTRAESFKGKWQHMIFGTSQGGITVALTKWNVAQNKRDTVALADTTLDGMAMSWANFTIPFEYNNLDYPDSCIIFLRASGSVPKNNDYLWVDNLSFYGTVTGVEDVVASTNQISVSPNPASKHLNLSFAIDDKTPVTIEMCDISGRVVYSRKAEAMTGLRTEVISLQGIAKGSYMVNVYSQENKLSSKIVVE